MGFEEDTLNARKNGLFLIIKHGLFVWKIYIPQKFLRDIRLQLDKLKYFKGLTQQDQHNETL